MTQQAEKPALEGVGHFLDLKENCRRAVQKRRNGIDLTLMGLFRILADRFYHLKELTRPQTVFRYRRINEYTLSELTDSSLYFAAFPELNDPYEGSYKYQPAWNDRDALLFINAVRSRGVSAEGFRKLFPQYQIDKLAESWSTLSDSQILEQIRGKIEQSFGNEATTKDISLALRRLDDSTVGLCCFSKLGRSPYMSWFYGDNHKGVCLEYSTSFHPFNRTLPVRYTTQFPKLITDHNFVLAKMLTKSPEWRQEMEWRIIQHLIEHGRISKFDPRALVSVSFCVETPDDQIAKVIDILRFRREQCGHVPALFRQKRSMTSYGFELERMAEFDESSNRA